MRVGKVSATEVREQILVPATHKGVGSQLPVSGVTMMSVLETSFCGGNGVSERQSAGSCSRAVLWVTAHVLGWWGNKCLPQTCCACVLTSKLQTGPCGGAGTCVIGVGVWDLGTAGKGGLCWYLGDL